MTTPEEAHELAKKAVESYVNACQIRTPEDVANVLMALAGHCGMAMRAVVGREDAVARMQATTNVIAQSQTRVHVEFKRCHDVH